MAGPYSWVASGGGLLYCVCFPSLLLFLCFCWFPVSCSSRLVFEVFIGVTALAILPAQYLQIIPTFQQSRVPLVRFVSASVEEVILQEEWPIIL